MTRLSSLQNPLVKRLTALRKERSERIAHKRCVVVGERFIKELPVKVITHLNEENATAEVLAKIAGHSTDGIAEVSLPEESSLVGCPRILALDGVADPGNVGTLVRTACALGWKGLLLLPGTADPFNDKALRASAGTLFHMQYRWAQDLEGFEGYQRLVADLEGEEVSEAEQRLLVLGSEGKGPSQKVREVCQPVTIGMAPEVESLNVAAAGAILMSRLA